MKKKFQLEVPGGADKVLLHTCCAPCSSAIIECLMQHGVTPVIYYCNPNIYPLEEYIIRKDECTRYAQSLGLEIIDADYDHDAWRCRMAGMEQEPERGGRCLRCFKMRLQETARYAHEHGFPGYHYYACFQPLEKFRADRGSGPICYGPLSGCHLLGTELA